MTADPLPLPHAAPPAPASDVVVVGASAGGVEALKRLAALLPEDMNAAVLVVLHLAPTASSVLHSILDRAGPLRAVRAVDGDPLVPRTMYVAQPDHHLLVVSGRVRLGRGPRENGYRPAIDTLFRSAAREYGGRVAGVVLSGALDDGTVGLLEIERRGGVCLVQDPAEALYGAMPASAVQHVRSAEVRPLADIARRLVELAPEGPLLPTDEGGPMPATHELEIEGAPPGGSLSALTCPDCGGALWEVEEGGPLTFRCHVGHAFTADAMDAEQANALDTALWAAVRALHERAALARRLARRLGTPAAAQRYLAQAEEATRQADAIRAVLTSYAPAGEASA